MQQTDEFMAREFIRCLMLIHDEVDFKLSKRETAWRHRACVFASGIKGKERHHAFRNLTKENTSTCVLIHGDAKDAERLHPECIDIAHGKIPRIFDASKPWNTEKSIVFSHYKYVIVIDPYMEDPLAGLESAMGESFELLRDTTRFVVQNT